MGYDPDIFVSKPDTELLCTICTDILAKPVSCPEGHTFCDSCLTEWLRTNLNCPTCHCGLTAASTSKNRVVQALIDGLQVRCEHATRRAPAPGPPRAKRQRTAGGCEWVGPLSALPQHRTECQAAPLPCPSGCGADVKRGELPQHVLVCPKRQIQCRHCKREMCHEALEAHIAEACPKVMLPCANECGSKCARKKMGAHLDECPMQPQACPYASCTARLPRAKIEEHVRGEVVAHTRLADQQIQSAQRDIVDLRQSVQTLEQELEAERASRAAVQQRLDRVQSEFDNAQHKATVTVRWTVDMADSPSGFQSGGFPIAGYELCFLVRLDKKPPHGSHLAVHLTHCGGLTWIPIGVGGTSVTLTTADGRGAPYTMTFPNDEEINGAHTSVGWAEYIDVSSIDTRGLASDGKLRFEATVQVAKLRVLRVHQRGLGGACSLMSLRHPTALLRNYCSLPALRQGFDTLLLVEHRVIRFLSHFFGQVGQRS